MQELCLSVLFFLLNYEQFNIYFFSRFRLLHFFFSNRVSDFFYIPQKTSYKKANHLIKAPFIKLDFYQNNPALRNVKCDWFISFIQVGRNRTHPIFQKLYCTNIWTSSLYEFVILHSQTSSIIQVVSYKSLNVRTA